VTRFVREQQEMLHSFVRSKGALRLMIRDRAGTRREYELNGQLDLSKQWARPDQLYLTLTANLGHILALGQHSIY